MSKKLILPRTLEELSDYTYKTEWAGTRSEGTAITNSNAVVSSIGADTLVGSIDKATLDLAVAEWKVLGNSPATCNRKLSSIGRMLSVAVELGIIDRRPPIKKLREPQGRIRWYTDEEQDRIMGMFSQLGFPEYWGIVRVLLDTGMRCGELFKLRWEEVNEDYIVLNDTKNYSPRSIPLTSAASRIIFDDWTTADRTGPFHWTTSDRTRTIWNKVRHQLGWSGDPGATLHACRHTFISNLVQEGVPIAMVQQLAGHKSLKMTLRYTHLQPKDLESAINKLECRRENVSPL